MDPVDLQRDIWEHMAEKNEVEDDLSVSRYLDKNMTYNSKQREKNFKNEEYSILVIIFNGI